jgi:copper transport protein
MLALLLGPAAPAQAHAILVSTSPPADAVLATAPAEVVLTFSESVRQIPGKIRVLGPDGTRMDRGEPTFVGAVVTIPVDRSGPRGTYLVSYRVVSADSHPVSGAYTYSVGEPSTPPVESEASGADPVVSTAVRVGKYLGYAGLVLLIGAAMVVALLWPKRLPRRAPARLAATGIGLVALATVAGMWLQMPYTNGGGPFAVSVDAFRVVLGSQFGVVHLIRLGVLIAAGLLLWALFAGRSGRADRVLLVILGAIGLATWPLSGHAAASPVPAVSVLVDTLHLSGMAVWLGGLLMLMVFLLPRANERELDAILPVWSRWAALSVSVLVIAGTVQALIEVGSLNALFDTTYGWLLVTKVLLFALVIGVAAYSRELVRRRIAPGRPGRLRRMVMVELVITAVILGVTAVLVQTPPARTGGIEVGSGSGYFSTTLTSSIYSLQVEIAPAQRGSNSIHVYAYTPDNKPLPVVEWSATAALPANGVEPIAMPMLPLTDNHATSEINLPTPGEWEFRFTVRISDIDQATVNVTVPIS